MWDKLLKYCQNNPIIILVSNPVDLLTYFSYKYTGFSKNKIIGSGTVLDTARFAYYLSQYSNININNIQTSIIGEHGDSCVPSWSLTKIGDINFYDYNNLNILDKKDNNILDELYIKTRDAGRDTFRKKGATCYGISVSVAKIIESLSQEEDSILPISSVFEGEFGIKDICLSVPTILSLKGVGKILKTPFSEEEIKNLIKSSEILKKVYNNFC
jgi:L-lactate dehydrogenase